MVWKIEWYENAFKALKGFPFHVQKRVLERVGKVRQDPFHFLGHFSGNFYKLRIGDYRALVDMDFENKTIKIRILDHRKRVYNRM